jgi:hypothetical protein
VDAPWPGSHTIHTTDARGGPKFQAAGELIFAGSAWIHDARVIKGLPREVHMSGEVRAEGFYWVILGQNPPEIAHWEGDEWWLAGDATPGSGQ